MNLTPLQRAQIVAAIDSHIYWQLSDERYRANGAVLEPGSDDPDIAAEIVAFEELQDQLNDADAAACFITVRGHVERRRATGANVEEIDARP
jgi:hypothetical protein